MDWRFWLDLRNPPMILLILLGLLDLIGWLIT